MNHHLLLEEEFTVWYSFVVFYFVNVPKDFAQVLEAVKIVNVSKDFAQVLEAVNVSKDFAQVLEAVDQFRTELAQHAEKMAENVGAVADGQRHLEDFNIRFKKYEHEWEGFRKENGKLQETIRNYDTTVKGITEVILRQKNSPI